MGCVVLIEFSVANFRSFRERQTLSMVASSAPEHREENTFPTGMKSLPAVLKTSVIYGPNASGKSNLVKALRFMQDFIVTSAKKGQEGDEIDVSVFAFDDSSNDLPSEFEVIFTDGDVRYHYGFAVDSVRVWKEWLIAYPGRSPQTWIERSYDPDTGQYVWGRSSNLKGKKALWQEATRANALFLSTAVQLNSDQLKPVLSWFRSKLRIMYDVVKPSYTVKKCKDINIKNQVLHFLQAADISISDVQFEDIDISDVSLDPNIPPAIAEELRKTLEGKKRTFIEFVHEVDGKQFTMPSELESDGTNKVFALAGPWLDVLENGRVIVVDELNNSLHPMMVRFLVKLFHNPTVNQSGAQLIMTTHDTTLMDKDVLRRDQIWFVEKDRCKCSRIYPLTEFSPRNKEALEKGYLQGRYGAIPYIGELVM